MRLRPFLAVLAAGLISLPAVVRAQRTEPGRVPGLRLPPLPRLDSVSAPPLGWGAIRRDASRMQSAPPWAAATSIWPRRGPRATSLADTLFGRATGRPGCPMPVARGDAPGRDRMGVARPDSTVSYRLRVQREPGCDPAAPAR